MLAKSRILFALLAIALAACGGSDDGADVDASAAGDDIDAAAGSGADAAAGDRDAEPGAADAGDPLDAAVEEGVACGDQTCGEGTECCFEGADPACVEVDTCGGATIGCTGPADCPEDGEVCCASGENAESSCVDEESCDRAFCETEDDCTSDNHNCCDVGDVGICTRLPCT